MSEELAVIDPEEARPTQALTLFGTADPVAVLAKAADVAKALAQVIRKQNLSTVIGTKEHIHVEGWTLLGSMLGVFPRIEWTHKLEDGWEARAVAVVGATGSIVGAGEAECLRGEVTWAKRDDHALRGMAQTRAISRALRGPLGFVVVLAGFAATPFEEMPPTADESFVARETARRAAAAATQGAGTSTPPPVPAPTPQEILERTRQNLAKPPAAEPLPEEMVCPRCGKAGALRPRGRPQFCAAKEGGCGAPARGDAFTLISRTEWESRQR